MIHIDVPAELKPWQPVIRRQLSLTLAPLSYSLRKMHVAFRAISKRGLPSPTFRCDLHGRSKDGVTYQISAQHSDGLTAISDACARARRAISRTSRQRSRSP